MTESRTAIQGAHPVILPVVQHLLCSSVPSYLHSFITLQPLEVLFPAYEFNLKELFPLFSLFLFSVVGVWGVGLVFFFCTVFYLVTIPPSKSKV